MSLTNNVFFVGAILQAIAADVNYGRQLTVRKMFDFLLTCFATQKASPCNSPFLPLIPPSFFFIPQCLIFCYICFTTEQRLSLHPLIPPSLLFVPQFFSFPLLSLSLSFSFPSLLLLRLRRGHQGQPELLPHLCRPPALSFKAEPARSAARTLPLRHCGRRGQP